jgi:ubiquinone/menaquinone biosynthesis C-methylase UbiE
VKALIKAQELYPESLHIAASADKLPFKNKSFDVTLLLFTLHHLNNKQWHKCLKEVERVTKDKIIIYDHVKNDSLVLRSIQMIYWKIFDGGSTYPFENEWKFALRRFRIKKYLLVGNLFNHICFYELTTKKW